jgi:hypothetical protein
MNKKTHVLTGVMVVLLAASGLVNLRETQAAANPGPTKKVVLKITFPDEEWVQAGATEGSLIRIERSGEALGFTPSVRDVTKGIVEVVISKITRQNGVDSLEEVARLNISGKTGGATVSNPSLKIQLISIDKLPEGNADKVMRFQPAKYGTPSATAAMMPDRCCVTCGSTTACSNCGVSMSCGGCCTGPCCGL